MCSKAIERLPVERKLSAWGEKVTFMRKGKMWRASPGRCVHAHTCAGEKRGSRDDSKVIVISDAQGQLPSTAQVLARHAGSLVLGVMKQSQQMVEPVHYYWYFKKKLSSNVVKKKKLW